MSVTTNYQPNENAIVHNTKVDFLQRMITQPIHLVQYDNTLPIIAIQMFKNGYSYTLPSGVDLTLKLRWACPDHVSYEALPEGISSDYKTVYFKVTNELSHAYGQCSPVLELNIGGNKAGSSAFPVIIDRSPVQHPYVPPTPGTVLADVAYSGQYSDILGTPNLSEYFKIENIVDGVTDSSTNKALSANQGRLLSARIDGLAAEGRYLSGWDCSTGQATTPPPTNPYIYKPGDYFQISNVPSSGTKYKPKGTQYDGTSASREVETGSVAAQGYYRYDGNGTWEYFANTAKIVSWKNLSGSPTDNAELVTELAKYILKNASAQTISVTTGDTAIHLKSASTSSFIGFKDQNGLQLGYLGINASKKPVFYSSTEQNLATESYVTSAINSSITTVLNTAV